MASASSSAERRREAHALVARLAGEVEEDEQLASLCHAVLIERLKGPLADRVVPLLRRALDDGDEEQARALVAGYFAVVDGSLVGEAEHEDADTMRRGLDALERGVEASAGDDPASLFDHALAYRRACERGEAP